jgi:Asp-tRNA(Asn)/Glu-tRNA(Gln) amidotransferase A subunit family amidase
MKSGKLTSHQLLQLYLDRIAAYDKRGPTINCIITLNPKAMEEADRLDAEYKKGGFVGPLHGIPTLVKDQVDAAGMPTTLGTVVFKDYTPACRFLRRRQAPQGRRHYSRQDDSQ